MDVEGAMVWLALACSGGDDEGGSPESAAPTVTDTETDPPGACGGLSYFDTTITGVVTDAEDLPLSGARVWLEERNWAPGTIHGTTTSVDGAIDFAVTDLPVLDGCWGTAVSYWLVGEADGADGPLTGEKPMNPMLSNAWRDGTGVSFDEFPLVLE